MSDLTEELNRQARDLCYRWNMKPDGRPILTPTSLLLPVSRAGKPCMLKIATEPEEAAGMRVLAWWKGAGAVRVLESCPNVLLMERPTGTRSLSSLANAGNDDEATRILCSTIATLHARPQADRPSEMVDLRQWFGALMNADQGNDLISSGKRVAIELLANQMEERLLHGDIHHENVLDGEERGWLAIDPKGLYGDRAFDYVNILRNPLSDLPSSPGRFGRQIGVICDAADLDQIRLLRWVLAFACLSACWLFEDGEHPDDDLSFAELASIELQSRHTSV